MGFRAFPWYHGNMNFTLGIKWRSLPNVRTYRAYLNAYMVILANYLGMVFIHFCLIAKDLVPLSPVWLLVVFPFVTIYEYLQIENRFKEVTRDDFKNLLTDLRQGQLQSFKEKLEERPEYLKSQYKGKTLLHWCKKYQNLKANKIIIDQMKKVS